MKLIVYTDGGSRGNPGPAASGIFITSDSGKTYAKFGTYLGIQTNNFAEYTAIIEALTWIAEHKNSIGQLTSVECRMDSQLACRQLQGVYKVKHPAIQPLFHKVQNLQQIIGVPFQFIHVFRNQNSIADGEVNDALDNTLLSS